MLTERCSFLCALFVRNPDLPDRFAYDSRVGHRFLFRRMTLPECSCIAGTYRGDKSCSFIEQSNVGVQSDPRLGRPFFVVAHEMEQFEHRCKTLMRMHQEWRDGPGKTQKPQNGLLKFARSLASILEQFLTIHPFKDGNGHTARLIAYSLMVKAGYIPVNWDIDSKQPYGQALSDHRNGKQGALQQFLLTRMILPPAQAPVAQASIPTTP